jgi:hypothetical protein
MDLLVYLAKSSCILVLFWVVYKIFLEAETYHRLKRIYLHLGYVLSLILPLFTFTKIEEIYLEKSSWAIPASFSSEFIQTEIKPSNFELIWSFIIENSLIEVLYISISMVFAVYLMVKFFRLIKFLKSSKAFKTEEITYIEKPISEGAFSFLNYIVYDPRLYTKDELEIILAHEQAHMSNKHSIDILFSHLYNCLFWFNPFAWLYQKSLVLNLEYEADDEAVAKTKKRDYQMTLYKATQQQYQSQLQHSFHQSPIKKRIMMLNKNKTQSFWKLFIVSPLLVVFFLLFQVETIAQVKESETTSEAKITKVEITYDENTTREVLDSDREFLKEEFNIDLSYSKLRFTSDRKLKSITLDVDCNDGFKGSVTSPDVEKLPVYFYRDFSEDVKKPFGVGTKRDDEQTEYTEPKDFKDVEIFIINKQKLNKSDLINSYIPVKQYTHMEDSNTLYITTRSDFSKPYYDGMFEAKDELNAIFEQGEPEGVVYFKVEKDNISVMTIDNFKIGKTSNASKPKNASSTKEILGAKTESESIKDAENFIINGKKVSKKKLGNSYIPVEKYTWDKNSKTLSLTTKPEFSKPYFSKILEIQKELIDKFGKNITEEMTFFKVSSDYEVIKIILTEFKIGESSADSKSGKVSLNNESSNQEQDSKNIRNAENFIINGKKVDKEKLLQQYIPAEDIRYDEQSKTLSVTTSSKFSESFYSNMVDMFKEIEGKYDDKALEGITYIQLDSDYKVSIMRIKNVKTSITHDPSKELGNLSLSSQSSNSKRAFLEPESKYKIQDMIIFVDGVKAEKGETVNINPDQIESVDILKSPEELKAEGYNSNFIKGIIKITTKKGKDINASQNDNQNNRSSLNNNQNVIFLIDGKEVESDQLNQIQPKDIESTVVVKSPTDLKKAGYDPKEIDGLIKITTKKETSINRSQRKNYNTIQKPAFAKNTGKLIYKVDEKEVDEEEFYKLKPEQVKSMVIIKSPDNLKRNGYDPKKIDGVIQISTKKGDSKVDEKIKIK